MSLPDVEACGVILPAHVREIAPPGRDLGLRGPVLLMGWELPPNLTEEDWREAGAILGKIERSLLWWVGDWWRHGEQYGRRAEIVSADDWDGPSHKTCRNAAVVCEAFDVSRRRDTLTFSHHAEVAALPAAEADALLDWAEEQVAATGKPRSTRELRHEIARLRAAAALDVGITEAEPPPDGERTAQLDPWLDLTSPEHAADFIAQLGPRDRRVVRELLRKSDRGPVLRVRRKGGRPSDLPLLAGIPSLREHKDAADQETARISNRKKGQGR